MGRNDRDYMQNGVNENAMRKNACKRKSERGKGEENEIKRTKVINLFLKERLHKFEKGEFCTRSDFHSVVAKCFSEMSR